MPELWWENGGVRLFAAERGAGPVLVMLHGPMATHATVAPLVAGLERDHRVIAPDLRGNGASRDGGAISFDRLSDDVRALLDHVGTTRAVVGGISGGAGVALRFALDHGERVRGLVLVSPVYRGAREGLTAAQRSAFARLQALAARVPREGIAALRPLYEELPARTRAGALALLEAMDPGSVVATARFLSSGEQPFDDLPSLRRIEAPALVVPGDDAMHPRDVAGDYAAHMPRARLGDAASIADFVRGLDAP